MDSQIIELLGRNRLVDELMRAGLEVAIPIRDRGVDLIAYADLESKVASFVACPIQMKASSLAAFGIDQKYQKFPGLILAHVWYLHDGQQTRTYATTYSASKRGKLQTYEITPQQFVEPISAESTVNL